MLLAQNWRDFAELCTFVESLLGTQLESDACPPHLAGHAWRRQARVGEIGFHVKHEAHFYPQVTVDNVTMIHITPFRHLWMAVDRSVDNCCGNSMGASLP